MTTAILPSPTTRTPIPDPSPAYEGRETNAIPPSLSTVIGSVSKGEGWRLARKLVHRNFEKNAKM
jgi:hypothetical protein